MSHQTYDREWKSVQEELRAALQSEPLQADRRENRKLLATLYVRYILICNKLSVIVDQMVHPQKRALIRKLLENTIGRVLELKCDLVEADLNEWTHVGDVVDILRVTPNQCELKVPACFRDERRDELRYKAELIDEVLRKLGYLDKTEKRPPMTEQQAIIIIQTHERARQGRLRAQFMKEIRMMKDKSKPTAAYAEGEEGEDKTLGISLPAAMRIQKMWRGYIARRATRRRKLQEMLLIGMIPPDKSHNEHIERDLEIKAQRRMLQQKREDMYKDAVLKCRENMEKNQRGTVLEQLSDQVRAWLHEYKTQTGKIPEYTGSERAGSRLMLSRQGTDSDVSKSTQMSSRDSKAKKEKGSKSKDSKSTGEEEEEESTKAIVSTFVPEMNTLKEEYDEMWKNRDESHNPNQYHYMDIIEQQQMAEMENELRTVVDEMMRAELLLLQEAMDRDRGHKGKKVKKASKKARKGSKKKKKEKDLTPDRTTESLFEELVANGIIKKCPEVTLKEFRGERSYNIAPPHNEGVEPKVALGDFRQILTEYCILPLLSDKIHQQTQHIRSLMLAGPKGSGKDMLVHAICHEAGALLFDLTPNNIVGKYPGKSGLIMLVHLVTKVARLLQPAVIYMDCAERPFVKKIPKTDKSDPKRLKKDLPKLVKNLCPEDRVMLIGVSSCPWDSDQKLLQQVYQKFLVMSRPDYSSRYCIWQSCLGKFSAVSWQFDTSVMAKISDGYTADLCPEDRVMLIGVSSCPWDSDQKLLQQVYQKFLVMSRPDYSSRYCIWQSCLGKFSAVSWQFDTSVMAKISDGYTAGAIVSTVSEVMTVKRMLQLRVHPLSPLELVNVLCTKTAVYKEEEDAMLQWWIKVPMVKRRIKAVETLIEEEAEAQVKQASAKSK